MAVNRRSFLKGTTLAAAATLAAGGVNAGAGSAAAGAVPTQLFKAHIKPKASDQLFEGLMKAGITGVELTDKTVSIEEARAGRKIAEKHGMTIHSFMGGWSSLGESDPVKRKQSVEDVKQWIRITAAYGGSTMLLVPHRIGGKMPKPTEFNIDFDPSTVMVKSVVDGDNAPYKKYIEDHNSATLNSMKSIQELIPVAAKEGVIIAVENVWNNLWVKPELALAYLKSFDSVWVRQYFDLGNHTRYDKAEKWLDLFGRNIAKLHIKDFKIERGAKNDGQFVPIGKGSIDWKSVRSAIERAGYNGWVSIESGGWTDQEHSRILDSIFAGKGAGV
ncbi:MAG: sugar phosphate isomerase/epimerase [Kiritimatiellae bacterium]|nr:sugar phosphate isomerase/epimerase [Kiritimatiellia bacterium]